MSEQQSAFVFDDSEQMAAIAPAAAAEIPVGITGKVALLTELAQRLHFPDYFGMNWDAVIDCLRDLADRQPAEGYVLFLHAAEGPWRQGLPWMGELVEVWLTAAEESAHDGVPLHLVFVIAAPA